jgi:small-conductance mechanosensitive channel
MNVVRLWRRTRRADRPAACVIGAANVLLSCLLLLLAIGVLTDPDTREEENAAWGHTLAVFLTWLLGGAALFAVLGMTRTLGVHVVTLLLPPVVLTVILLLL